jgi:hypothetical protein
MAKIYELEFLYVNFIVQLFLKKLITLKKPINTYSWINIYISLEWNNVGSVQFCLYPLISTYSNEWVIFMLAYPDYCTNVYLTDI